MGNLISVNGENKYNPLKPIWQKAIENIRVKTNEAREARKARKAEKPQGTIVPEKKSDVQLIDAVYTAPETENPTGFRPINLSYKFGFEPGLDRPIETRFLRPMITAGVSSHFGTTNTVNPDQDLRQAIIQREAGAGFGYDAYVKAEGTGELFEIFNSSTSLTWALGLHYKEEVDYRKSFNTDFDYNISNQYFLTRGWVGYSGMNFFGKEIGSNGQSVPDEFLTRANPEVTDLVYAGGVFQLPFNLGNNGALSLKPYLGFNAQAADVNYYRTIDRPHYLGETIYLGGLQGSYKGYDFMVEYGKGAQGEAQEVYTQGATSDSSPFSTSDDDLMFRPVTTARLEFLTPEIGGTVRLEFTGNYKTYGENEIVQMGFGTRGYFKNFDVGLGFEDMPVKYIGDNSRITIDGHYKFDWSLTEGIYSPITFGPSVTYVTYPDDSSDVIWGINLTTEIGQTKNTSGYGSSTLVERLRGSWRSNP